MARHTAQHPSWQLPAVGVSPCYRAPRTWAVVFLCGLEEDQRRAILDQLCSVDKTWTEDRPAADAYPRVNRLVEVPWLRDSEPSPACIPSIIFQIYRAMCYPKSLFFIDRQAVADGTAIIFHGHSRENGDATRVPINRAALALSLAFEKPLAVVLPDFESGEIFAEESYPNTPKGRRDKTGVIHELPRHLPSDLKLEPSTLTLISLVHIPDDQLDEIKAEIGSSNAVPQVSIYNWPADQEPCSRAELYRIFQATKPPYQEDVDETFSLFIDREYPMNNEGFCIIVAHETLSSGNEPISLEKLCSLENAIPFWHAIWNPFEYGRRGTCLGDARVNTTIFDGPLQAAKSTFEIVSSPDNLAFPAQSFGICCFVLSQMTETQFRYMRQELFSEVEDTMQFVDVSHLIKTPDMQGLMAYFESDQYVQSGQAELPLFFLALDAQTLEGLETGDLDDAVLAADATPLSVDLQDDDSNCYGVWSLGYAYGRLHPECAVNLSIHLLVANMSFSEYLEGQELEFSSWSVFRKWTDVNRDLIQPEMGSITLEVSCRDLPDSMFTR